MKGEYKLFILTQYEEMLIQTTFLSTSDEFLVFFSFKFSFIKSFLFVHFSLKKIFNVKNKHNMLIIETHIRKRCIELDFEGEISEVITG